jgi:MerR family transcriptional regulator, light-induced transcriptional regulator
MNQTPPESPKPTEYRYVNTTQVARALGISVTTVKRWVDDGVLPAHRTAGGHRKLLVSDVIKLTRDNNMPRIDLSMLLGSSAANETGNTQMLHTEMFEAIKTLNFDMIRDIIHCAYKSGIAIETIADRMISPAMMHVGHEWSVGRIEVMHEHRITQAVVSAMYELKSFTAANVSKDSPVAIGGAPEFDHYILPSLLAKMTLIDSGWNAINLGPNTPFFAMKSAIDELKPRLVWLSVSHIENADTFIKQYHDFFKIAEDRSIAIAIGGRGLADSIRSQMPYTTFGDGMTHIASFAKSLHRPPSRPKRGRPSLNEQISRN